MPQVCCFGYDVFTSDKFTQPWNACLDAFVECCFWARCNASSALKMSRVVVRTCPTHRDKAPIVSVVVNEPFLQTQRACFIISIFTYTTGHRYPEAHCNECLYAVPAPALLDKNRVCITEDACFFNIVVSFEYISGEARIF